MANWCTRYGDIVNFICISVGGSAVARYFGRHFTGECINATMLEGEVPLFPIQLGCSGFVVIDQHCNIVTTKSTPRFLDDGQLAFRGVEKLLSGILGKSVFNVENHDETSNQHDLILSTKLNSLPHVGYPEMDYEHKLLDECLSKLIANPSRSLMLMLRNLVADHFLHEEEFLLKMNFGTSGVISGHQSHVSDHKRVLSIIDDVLENTVKTEDNESNVVDGDVAKIAYIIYQHGIRFDSLYAKNEDKFKSRCEGDICRGKMT